MVTLTPSRPGRLIFSPGTESRLAGVGVGVHEGTVALERVDVEGAVKVEVFVESVGLTVAEGSLL